MDLSHLTRPSILCQCARCSSSVAACENEWAKLSNTYSTLTGWVSLDMNRINVSPEKKQIPQSSDLTFVRGCVIQEIVCRLCHQKLGALVHFETGAKIFWKLSKLSFREIISMRETVPRFKEGTFVSHLSAQPVPAPDSSAAVENAEVALDKTSVQQQIQNQGMSLNRISSSVGELYDTMTDLKHAFTDLRIELNTPGSRGHDAGRTDGSLDMLKVVLKELQMKSNEIEKLRLENESLKLKNRMLTDIRDSSAVPPYLLDTRSMPEVHSPGFLNEHGKRGWPEAITDHRHQQQIADSFDEYDNDLVDDAEVERYSLPPMKIPLKPADRSASPPRLLQNGKGGWPDRVSKIRRDSREPAAKRPRLASREEIESPSGVVTEKKRPGRPRKTQASTSDGPGPQTPVPPVPLPERDSVDSSVEPQREKSHVTNEDDIGSSGGTQARGRTRRARSKAPSRPAASRAVSRAPSRAPSVSPIVTRGASMKAQATQVHQENTTTTQNEANNGELIEVSVNVDGNADGTRPAVDPQQKPEEKENVPSESATAPAADGPENKRRRSQAAARDLLAKLTMEREEAMGD